MSYRWSPLTEADTPEWSELITVIAEHDGSDELYSAADLAEELALPSVDPSRDTLAVRDDDTGALVAFGQLFFRDELIDDMVAAHATGGVHPEHRRRGIGSELMRRVEDRAVAGAAERHPGVATCLRSDVGVQVAEARELMADRGFVEDRFFHVMTHDLAGLVASHAPSLGLRRYDADTDAEAVRNAHNDAFAAHWRSAAWSAAEWTSRVGGSRTFRPDLSFIQPGPDGSIDGYVLSFEYVPGDLYIGMLGVRPQRRGRGTGAALLRTALAAGLAAGFRRAELDVDSANRTGAGRLYESVGFRTARSTVAALKRLPPARLFPTPRPPGTPRAPAARP